MEVSTIATLARDSHVHLVTAKRYIGVVDVDKYSRDPACGSFHPMQTFF